MRVRVSAEYDTRIEVLDSEDGDIICTVDCDENGLTITRHIPYSDCRETFAVIDWSLLHQVERRADEKATERWYNS